MKTHPNGKSQKGSQKKLFQKNQFSDFNLSDKTAFIKFRHGLEAFKILSKGQHPNTPINRSIYAKIYAYSILYFDSESYLDTSQVETNVEILNEHWKKFIKDRKEHAQHGRIKKLNKATGEFSLIFSESKYLHSEPSEQDILKYFSAIKNA